MINQRCFALTDIGKEEQVMKVKDIVFPAVGIALFVALSMCLRVPIFDNYYLCLGYIVMTVFIWCYKWYEGAVVGFFGVILYCIIGGLGFNGMPGWAVGNIAIGLIMGLSLKFFKSLKSRTMLTTAMAVAAIVSTFIGIELIKSFIDSFIVAQPFAVRFAKNMTSFISDAFVIVASLPICLLVEKEAKRLRFGD